MKKIDKKEYYRIYKRKIIFIKDSKIIKEIKPICSLRKNQNFLTMKIQKNKLCKGKIFVKYIHHQIITIKIGIFFTGKIHQIDSHLKNPNRIS